MRKNKDTNFWESLINNKNTFNQFLNRLTELSLAVFEWKNLPDSIDPRFLEMTLFGDGMAIFFNDEVMGNLCLQCMIGGQLDVYRIPIDRVAYASNGYNKNLTNKNSVIIWNNMLHTNSLLDVQMFSTRLYNIDRTIDVNVRTQKTPILISCNENEKISLKNAYQQYDGNQPVIYGTKGLTSDTIKAMKTDAPFISDQLYELKTKYWNEALTFLGIPNIQETKKERLVTDEVVRGQGGAIASQYSRLGMRKQACKEINKMFNLDIDVKYKDGIDTTLYGKKESEVNEYE